MKKVLLTLGVCGMLALAVVACGDDKNDCDCTVTLEGTPVKLDTINDFDGECSEITEANLPTQWQNITDLGGTISCVEH